MFYLIYLSLINYVDRSILTYGNKYLSEILPLSLKYIFCSSNNCLLPSVGRLFELFSLNSLLDSLYCIFNFWSDVLLNVESFWFTNLLLITFCNQYESIL